MTQTPKIPQPDEKLLRLRKSITLKGDTVTYDTLSLREPIVDELDRSIQTAGSAYAQNAALISMVAAVPVLVVRQMGKRDYEEATDYLTGFSWTAPVPEVPDTGEALSPS
jgi:hypothetical protein